MKHINELSTLEQTLFIPLAVRAKESECAYPTIMDRKAIDIFQQCDTSGLIIDGGSISAHGILARTKIIDIEVKSIINKNPNAIVINLGAGLDTRFFRLDNGRIQWYDLDLPEVISLRKQFIPEDERLHYIPQSILDDSWISQINYSENDTVILIAEGIFMYFSEDEVRKILNLLAENFPDANLCFDVVHRFFVGKKISANFLWGIAKAEEIKRLCQNISLVNSWSAGNLLKQRQSLLYRLLNVFPSTRNRSQIMHLKFER